MPSNIFQRASRNLCAVIVTLCCATVFPLVKVNGQDANGMPKVAPVDAGDKEQKRIGKWEESIARFEKADRDDDLEAVEVMFVGSSSIRGWDLKKSFPNQDYLNRGFGGSHIADSIHYFDRFIAPRRPQIVVFYAGDNDIASGKSVDQVVSDFEQFVRHVTKQPQSGKLVFVAIKPSLKRWAIYPQMAEANQRIQEICDADDRLFFADIAKPMLGKEGEPLEKFFVDDGLHLTEQGYQLWTKIVRRSLEEASQSPN